MEDSRSGDGPHVPGDVQGDEAARERLKHALWTKSQHLASAERESEELEALDELRDLFRESMAPDERGMAAGALFHRAALLRDMGRDREALAAWDEVMDRFAADPPTEAPFVAMRALYGKAHNLYEAKRPDEAVATADALIERYGSDDATEVQLTVAQAMGVKRDALGEAGRFGDALAANDELIGRFGDTEQAALRERVASALAQRTWLFLRLGRMDEASRAADELLDRFDRETDATTVGEIGNLVLRTARILAAPTAGRGVRLRRRPPARLLDQAEKMFGDVYARFSRSGDPELEKVGVRALIDEGAALARGGRLREATAVNEKIFELGAPAVAALEDTARDAQQQQGLVMKHQFEWALIARAIAITQLGHRERSISALDEVLDQFSDTRSPPIKYLLRQARKERDKLLAAA